MKGHYLGESNPVPPCNCPNCGYVSDMAAPVDKEAMPKEGDISICINCGHLSVFNEHLDLRQPTDEEIKQCAGDKRIVAAMTALGLAKADREKKPLDPNIIFPGKDLTNTFPEEET